MFCSESAKTWKMLVWSFKFSLENLHTNSSKTTLFLISSFKNWLIYISCFQHIKSWQSLQFSEVVLFCMNKKRLSHGTNGQNTTSNSVRMTATALLSLNIKLLICIFWGHKEVPTYWIIKSFELNIQDWTDLFTCVKD